VEPVPCSASTHCSGPYTKRLTNKWSQNRADQSPNPQPQNLGPAEEIVKIVSSTVKQQKQTNNKNNQQQRHKNKKQKTHIKNKTTK
jgi:hypothetical protein